MPVIPDNDGRCREIGISEETFHRWRQACAKKEHG